jgi:hypothetical protein
MSKHDSTGLKSAGTTDAPHPDLPRPSERQLAHVAGGLLVYQLGENGVTRELVGFAEVESREEIADALAARGLGRGAAWNKPEFGLTVIDA